MARWIQKATPEKTRGDFTAYAKAHGGLTKEGKIDPGWRSALIERLRKKSRGGTISKEETRLLRQANLAKTLAGV